MTVRVPRPAAGDGCPGALRMHRAADGGLIRVRLPGGMIDADALAALAAMSTEFGSGTMELTSRGNVQLRGITGGRDGDGDGDDPPPGLATALAEAGLLPSASHEIQRNVIASPLSGRRGGLLDVRPLVAELDTAIQASGALADLPGRFLFALDDGSADVAGLRADAGVVAVPGAGPESDPVLAVQVAGVDTGARIDPRDAATTLAGIAERFVAVRENAWRAAELVHPAALVDGLASTDAPGAVWPAVTQGPVGWIEQDDGRVTLGAAIPLGLLTARVAEYLAAVGAPMVVTPWRSVLLCDLDEGVADAALRVLPTLGLVFDENSPWLAVSACTGRPGCARAQTDTRADVATGLAALPRDGRHRHFVGCERGCGSPPEGEVVLLGAAGRRTLRAASGP